MPKKASFFYVQVDDCLSDEVRSDVSARLSSVFSVKHSGMGTEFSPCSAWFEVATTCSSISQVRKELRRLGLDDQVQWIHALASEGMGVSYARQLPLLRFG